MWNVLICDDNKDVLVKLRQQLMCSASQWINSIYCLENAEKLWSLLEEYPKESYVILMDIELGTEENGIQLAQRIKEKKSDVQIIFISAYPAYFEEVYDVEHIYFLVKPFDGQRLEAALRRAGTKLDEDLEQVMTIIRKDGIIQIPKSDIYYIESRKRLLNIHTKDEEYSTYGKMDVLEREMESYFVRCHNSFMVNMNKVKQLEPNCFLLKNGDKVFVSRGYSKKVKQRFLEFIESTGKLIL